MGPLARGGLLLRVVLLATAFIAYGDDANAKQDGTVQAERTPPVPDVQAPAGETRIEEVVIYDDRVEPRQLTLTAGAPAEMQVANRSRADCTFVLGEYLQGLHVPAGQTATMGLILPTGRSTETVRMGGEGDPGRQVNALIELKGVLPGPGR